MDYLSELELMPALAKKRHRYLAGIIDYFLFMVLFFALTHSIGERGVDENESTVYSIKGIKSLLVPAMWFVLFPLIEGLAGQTLGKKILQIKVVKNDYSKINIGSSITRRLFDIINYLPFLGIAGLLVSSNNNKKQQVGDLVAKTIAVVNDSKVI